MAGRGPFLYWSVSVSICPTSKAFLDMVKAPDELMFFVVPSKIPFSVENIVVCLYGFLGCFLKLFVFLYHLISILAYCPKMPI